MGWILTAGGLPGFFVAAFGVAALVSGGLFLRSPDARRLEFIRRMTLATLFSVGAGVAAAVAAVLTRVPAHPEWSASPDLHLIVMQGLGETMAPAIVGFTLLSLAHFLVALGIRRMPAV